MFHEAGMNFPFPAPAGFVPLPSYPFPHLPIAVPPTSSVFQDSIRKTSSFRIDDILSSQSKMIPESERAKQGFLFHGLLPMPPTTHFRPPFMPPPAEMYAADMLEQQAIAARLWLSANLGPPPGVLERTPLRIGSTVMSRLSPRRKGGQVRFSSQQTAQLEARFNAQKYLSPQERRRLARSLALSDRQVKTWFQNRRAKWRRLKTDDGTGDDETSAPSGQPISTSEIDHIEDDDEDEDVSVTSPASCDAETSSVGVSEADSSLGGKHGKESDLKT